MIDVMHSMSIKAMDVSISKAKDVTLNQVTDVSVPTWKGNTT